MEDSEKPENCESRKRSREEDEGEEKPEEVEEVSAKRPNNQPSSTVYFKLLVPSSAAGAIIGKGGDTINQLQADTATNIKMSKGGDFFPGTTDRVCMVIGSLENVRKVHSFLLDKVKEKPDATGSVGDAKAKIVVPNSTASLIIGKSGDNINHIKERTNAFIQVSPKSTNTEKPLSERVITISGDRASCEMAVDMILEKIVDDPQSGTCTNISYTDGPILPQSSIASLFATNLTSSLHLPVTGHPAMDALKFILRAKGYNEAATREVTAAMYTLASYGFIQLRTPAIPTMTQQEWPTSSAEGLASAAAYYAQAQGREATNASSAATNTSNQTQDQSNYANYYNSFYNNSGNYGNGYNAGGSYDNNYANTNYNAYGNSGMQSGMQDMSGYSSGMGQGNYPSSGMGQGNYPSSGMAQGNYPMGSGTASSGGGNYSMASGGYQGGMGEFGAQGSGGPPAPPNNDASMARQEVDVAENVLQAMMGAEGKGIMEIQQWCGVTIEVVQKAQFMHTVKVMGPQNSVQSALYIIQQYVQHAEYKRYYEGQTGQQQQQQQQQQGSHQ